MCPEGYTLQTGVVPAVSTDCNGNINTGAYCIKTMTEANTWCQTNDCVIVSETNNAGWLAQNPYSVAIVVGIGSTMTSNAYWESCVKDGAGKHLQILEGCIFESF